MYTTFWIVALILSIAAAIWVYRADKQKNIPAPWLTALLRGLVVLLTLLLLIEPVFTIDNKQTQKPVVIFLQDNSASIPLALREDTAVYKKNGLLLLDKLQADYKLIKWGFGNHIQADTIFNYQQQATDISSALTQAVERYGLENIGAIILATDGRYNIGNNPLYENLQYQGAFYAVALGDSAAQKDIRIAATYANKTVSLNNQFEIRGDIVAQNCEGYNKTIQLIEVGGAEVERIPISISNNQFDKTVSFTLKANSVGLHHYRILATSVDGELNTSNNAKDIFVEVVNEQKKILIAAAAPHPDINAIREALTDLEGYHVLIKIENNIPTSFDGYDIIVLHDLPSPNIPISPQAIAKKPVWFIMGYGASNPLINAMQDAVKLNVNPQNLQSTFVTLSPSFTAFTLPPTINTVVDKLPPLATPAGTISETAKTIPVFYAKGKSNMPLWVLQEGMPPKAILIGEGLWRWRISEYQHFNTHQVTDELIRQTISFLGTNVNDKPFQVTMPKYTWSDQEPISFNAWLLNANNEQVNTSDVQMVILDSTGRKQNFSFEKIGNAYKLNIGLLAGGNYTYNAITKYNGTTYTAMGKFTVQHILLEAIETGANYPLLFSLAHKYNGTLVSYKHVATLYDSIQNNPNIKPTITMSSDSVPLIDWKWYFLCIAIMAVAEWLLRKYWMAQ